MEYRLYIDQDVFVEWPTDVDIIDAAIVKAIWQYQSEQYAPGLERDQHGFVWLDQAYLVAQLPLLGLGVEAMRKRLRKLCEEHFLLERRHYPMKTETGVHKRVYYHTSPEFDALFLWFKGLHDKAANGDETAFHRSRRPDIEGAIKDRRERKQLSSKAEAKRPKLHRDEHGRFMDLSTYPQAEPENSNPSNGTTIPFTAVPRYRSQRYDGTVDSCSTDSRSSDVGSSFRADGATHHINLDRSGKDLEARRKLLARQAEQLLREEEAKEVGEGEAEGVFETLRRQAYG